MAKCKRCGATLSEKAAFCTICGTPTSGARPAVPAGQPSTTKCANCGRLLRPGQKFCTGCGASVTSTTPTTLTRTLGPSEPCPHCGFANNPPDSYYCINCGQTLNSTSASPPPDEATPEAPLLSGAATSLSCSACGRQAKPGSKFCIYCGGKLTAIADAPTETSALVPE
ncbi:MAG: zinc ribbon domain-containing protein, partial [Candidatus Hermodarchaeota archaeon]|nr:zinc ribbon domain-containing protein [Candidatus Hermodarchaeota archaeon]